MSHIHDPLCAVILDIAESEDWDDPSYVPVACTCKTGKARMRIEGSAASLSSHVRGMDEGSKLAEGCYIKRPSKSFFT